MNKRAITLAEAIIVVAVMMIVAAISITYLSRFTLRTSLESASRSITSALRTARSYAISNNDLYYVEFDIAGRKYSITDAGSVVVDKEYYLPTGVEFRRPAGGNIVTFLKGTRRACFTPTGSLDTDDGAAVFIAHRASTSKGYGYGGYEWRRVVVQRTTGAVNIDEEDNDG